MQAKFCGIPILAIALALALSNASFAASGGFVPYKAEITFQTADENNGPCDMGYSATCGTGDCVCLKLGGSGTGPVFGKAGVILSLTLDLGDSTLSGKCVPGFGNLSINGSKDSIETFDIVVSYCSFDQSVRVAGGFDLRQPSKKISAAVGQITGSSNGNELMLQGEAKE